MKILSNGCWKLEIAEKSWNWKLLKKVETEFTKLKDEKHEKEKYVN